MEFLLEPLSYGFMVRALLVSALVGGVCGLLSCFMTLKGWALMGDAVSHAVLPGVVIAYGLGLPLSLGAFVFGVGSVAAIGFVKQMSRVKEDTVIGLVFTAYPVGVAAACPSAAGLIFRLGPNSPSSQPHST